MAALAAGATWKVEEWRFAALRNEEQKTILADTFRRVERADVKAENHEKQKTIIQTKFKTIEKEVERVVNKTEYRDICLDDDGMRAIAIAIAASPSASQPASAVRRSD